MSINDFKNIAKISLFNDKDIKGLNYLVYNWKISIIDYKLENRVETTYFLDNKELTKKEFLKSLN